MKHPCSFIITYISFFSKKYVTSIDTDVRIHSCYTSFFITFLSLNYLDSLTSHFRDTILEQQQSFSSLEKKYRDLSSLYEEKKKEYETTITELQKELDNSMQGSSSLQDLIALINRKSTQDKQKLKVFTDDLSKKEWKNYFLQQELQEITALLNALSDNHAL